MFKGYDGKKRLKLSSLSRIFLAADSEIKNSLNLDWLSLTKKLYVNWI